MATKKTDYELKDQSTVFYDPETQLKVTRDKPVTIDQSKRVGKLTLAAIKGGALVEVNAKSQADEGEAGFKGKK